VRIDDTAYTSVTDDEGRFVLISVPPGRHVIAIATSDGREARIRGVAVFADHATSVELAIGGELPPAADTGEPPSSTELLAPVAGRLSSSVVITAEELIQLPVRGYHPTIALQTGVVQYPPEIGMLHTRGGRDYQTGYFVDGFVQSDPFTGLPFTDLSYHAIDQIVLHRGGFGADYGRYGTGIVQVITQRPGEAYFGTFEAVSDNLAGDWIGSPAADFNIYSADVGGPIPGTSHTFYLTGERRWLGDWLPSGGTKEMIERARSTLGTAAPTHADSVVLAALENDRLPSNSESSWNWLGTIRLNTSRAGRLLLSTQGLFSERQHYLHEYLFDHPHTPRTEDRVFKGFAEYSHRLGRSTSISGALRYHYNEHKAGDGVYLDELILYARPGGNPRFDLFSTLFWNIDDPDTPTERSDLGVIISGDETHVFSDYQRRIASYFDASVGASMLVRGSHLLDFGGDYRRHTLQYYQHLFPTRLYDDNLELVNVRDIDRYGFGVKGFGEHEDPLDGERHPVELGLHVQDRFEIEGAVIRVGLRYDRFDSNTLTVKDPTRPLDGDPDHPESIPGRLDPTDLIEVEPHNEFSPRLGISLAPGARTSIHFNAGRYSQTLPFDLVYTSWNYFEHKVMTGGYFYGFGNPELGLERVTAYEAGIAFMPKPDVMAQVSTYHNDLDRAAQITNVETQSSTTKSYARYEFNDFGSCRGLEIDLTLRRKHRFAGRLGYTLSSAKATGSTPGTNRQIAWTASRAPDFEYPVDYDQRHKLTVDLDYRFGRADGPTWGSTHPLADFGVHVLWKVGSGFPYTPIEVLNEVTLAALPNTTPTGPLNSARTPWTQQLDLKIDKGFDLGGSRWNVYLWIVNLFDRDNVIDVYAGSGSATSTSFLDTETGYNTVGESQPYSSSADPYDFYRLKEYDPAHFGPPRQVRFGLKVGF
jgi:hypothetical protein